MKVIIATEDISISKALCRLIKFCLPSDKFMPVVSSFDKILNEYEDKDLVLVVSPYEKTEAGLDNRGVRILYAHFLNQKDKGSGFIVYFREPEQEIEEGLKQICFSLPFSEETLKRLLKNINSTKFNKSLPMKRLYDCFPTKIRPHLSPTEGGLK